MGPFDRFNDRAKRVLALAQDEAIRFSHNYMGVEHLLLGLVREGEGVPARVLHSLGVELSKLRTSLEFVVGRGDSQTPPTDITLSPRMKKVIELGIDEAKKLGHSHVGPEHLLLGIVRDGGSVAIGMLESLGVSPEQIRAQTIATLGRAAPHTSGPDVQVGPGQVKKRDWYCEDVLSGKLKVNVIWEDERVIAFHHPRPEAPIHAVAIPKKHITSMVEPGMLDGELLSSMVRAVQEVAHRMNIAERGFQLRSNTGAPGVTPHVHWHVMGPGIPPQGAAWEQRAVPVTAARATGKGPFERLDDSAKRVLALAQDEAIRLNHNYIGTEHLLAGVVREGSGAGARALAGLGVELSKVRTALEFIIGRGDSTTAPNDITLSPRTKKVLELAIDEAGRLGHSHAGSAHILLGIVREGEGIASGILESLKVSLESVRQKTIELLGRTT